MANPEPATEAKRPQASYFRSKCWLSLLHFWSRNSLSWNSLTWNNSVNHTVITVHFLRRNWRNIYLKEIIDPNLRSTFMSSPYGFILWQKSSAKKQKTSFFVRRFFCGALLASLASCFFTSWRWLLHQPGQSKTRRRTDQLDHFPISKCEHQTYFWVATAPQKYKSIFFSGKKHGKNNMGLRIGIKSSS